MRIYCDGIFDLFHKGHRDHLLAIRRMFPSPHEIVVGVISDSIATEYKRRPMFNEMQRLRILSLSAHVDEVFVTDQLVMDPEFLAAHRIDRVAHAFSNAEERARQFVYFSDVIAKGVFIELDYVGGFSTTKTINDNNLTWDDIWMQKGLDIPDGDKETLVTLGGWEHTEFDPAVFVETMSRALSIKAGDSVLEVGCGAGLVASHLRHCEYMGTDASSSLIAHHIRLFQNCALTFRSSEVIFKDDSFDVAFLNGVVEYLPDLEDVAATITELERVAKRGVYVAYVRRCTHKHKLKKHIYKGTYTHLIVPEDFFVARGYTVEQSSFGVNVYNAWKLF